MTDRSYEDLLSKAKKSLPDHGMEDARLKVPEPVLERRGKQTIIKNMADISKTIRREPAHIASFLFKELAVPGSISGSELVLHGKASHEIIIKRMNDYLERFVMCHEC